LFVNSIVWNTTNVSNGNHTLTAVARDAIGNLRTVSVVVTVTHGSPAIPQGDSAIPGTLTLSRSGSGGGTVTSSPGGLDCGSTCTAAFDTGQTVALTATPDPGATFAGWSGDPDCLNSTLTVSIPRTCEARFDLPQTDSTLIRADFDGDGKADI